MTTRRDFAIGAGVSAVLAPTIAPAQESGKEDWDQGKLLHLLPTVSHDRILIKASFGAALAGAPELRVGETRVRGRKDSAEGDFWQFDVTGLKPQTRYRLALSASDGRPLCEPWSLSTFPAPDATPPRLRLLIYTCAGGHDVLNQG